jgi:transcriptional antiterminator Rof (Rho-off)
MQASYRPIPCIQHERLEFAVLRRTPLLLTYVTGGERQTASVLALDVYTRDGAEWLSFSDEAGKQAVIRLDQIVEFQERPL